MLTALGAADGEASAEQVVKEEGTKPLSISYTIGFVWGVVRTLIKDRQWWKRLRASLKYDLLALILDEARDAERGEGRSGGGSQWSSLASIQAQTRDRGPSLFERLAR